MSSIGSNQPRRPEQREERAAGDGEVEVVHRRAHLLRAAQEGIAFAFKYGMNIMKETGIELKLIRAGNANLFLSPIFRETLATITGVQIELYDTDGALGAARGAAVGAGFYASFKDAFVDFKVLAAPLQTLRQFSALRE